MLVYNNYLKYAIAQNRRLQDNQLPPSAGPTSSLYSWYAA